MHKLFGLGLGVTLLFASVPSSSNYTLKSYDIGTGGNSSSSSSNYKLNGASGGQSTGTQSSVSYTVGSGVNNTINTNVPAAPTFTNPASYYDRLKLVLNPGSAPTDSKYLIAISSDNFVTTNYIQADDSVANSQAIANYQTYTTWGGSSGFFVLGLSPATTYQVKVKALQGNFSGSPFGPTASAATAGATLTFALSTTATATPPFNVGFTTLTPGTVVDGTADAVVTVTSNANNGGTVYAKSANAGLLSATAAATIASANADLSSASSGYGALVTATSQTSGGPFTAQSPFNGSSNVVGGLTTALQPVLTTTAPVTAGSGTVRLKAKASTVTPSAADYADTLTFIVAMNY